MGKGAVAQKSTEKGRGKKDSDEAYTTHAGKPKKEKDPNAPKRPISSYFLFMNDRRKTLKTEKPDAGMGEQTKIMTEEWKALTEKQKKKWDDLAAVDKERYHRQMNEAGMGKPTKDENAVKKPLSGYMWFGKECRDKLTKQGLSATDIMKKIGEEWKGLSEKQKEKYEKMAKDDKTRFEKETKAAAEPTPKTKGGKAPPAKAAPAKKVDKKAEEENDDEEDGDEDAETEN